MLAVDIGDAPHPYITSSEENDATHQINQTWQILGVKNPDQRSGDVSFALSGDGATRISSNGFVSRWDGNTWQQIGEKVPDGRKALINNDGTIVVVDCVAYRLADNEWTILGSTVSDTYSDYAISSDGLSIAVSQSSGLGTTMVLRFQSGAWLPVGQILQGEQILDDFGSSVSISADGLTLAIGAPINFQSPAYGSKPGYVKVFELLNGSWLQRGNTIFGSQPETYFGEHVAISADGNVLASLSSSEAGFGGSGLAQVYESISNVWQQKGDDFISSTKFTSVDLALNGNALVLGANDETTECPNTQNRNGKIQAYRWSKDRRWENMAEPIRGGCVGQVPVVGYQSTVGSYGTNLSENASRLITGNNVYELNESWGINSGYEIVFPESTPNTGPYDPVLAGNTGQGLKVSGDGNTLAVGAPDYSVGGVYHSGQVRIYQNVNGEWIQKGQTLNGNAAAEFGFDVDLNFDGTVLAVASRGEATSAGWGSVRIYHWDETTWNLMDGGNIVMPGTITDIALDAAGETIAVGAVNAGIGGAKYGRVHVHDAFSSVWSLTKKIIGKHPEDRFDGDSFGLTVDISDAGDVIAVGAPDYGIKGNPLFGIPAIPGNGGVFFYQKVENVWSEMGTGIINLDQGWPFSFGTHLSISGNGRTIAIGVEGSSDAFGMMVVKPDLKIYDRSGDNWILSASSVRTEPFPWINNIYYQYGGDAFGEALDLDYQGDLLAVGSPLGIGEGMSAVRRGEVYIYERYDQTWVQESHFLSSPPRNPLFNEYFGMAVSMSSRGGVLGVGAVSAYDEESKGYVEVFERAPVLGEIVDVDYETMVAFSADDDGVLIPVIMPSTTAELIIKITGRDAFVDGWIDFDGDGAWSEHEQILRSTPVHIGDNKVQISIPDEVGSGEIYGRFRASREIGLFPTGFAQSGEVEDYRVFVSFPPNIGTLTDVELNEDSAEFEIALNGISAGKGENQPLRVTASSDNTTLVPQPAVLYNSASPTGALKFTPAADLSGVATITVTVEDGGLDGDLATVGDNLSISRSFSVTVNAVNDIPTFDALTNVSIDEDAAEQIVNLTGINAGGGESQPLRVTATSSNTSLIAEPTANYTSADETGTLRFTPLTDQSGVTTITVTVEDGGLDGDLATAGDNASYSRTFDVTVNSVNDVPTLDLLESLKIDEDSAEQIVNLSGISAGGGENQPLRVTASSSNADLIPDPSVTYSSGDEFGSLLFTPIADQHGSATITLTVEDAGFDGNFSTLSDNERVSQIFEITVSNINETPTLNPVADLVADEDTSFLLVNLNGITAGLNESQPLRVVATSSNADLISDPEVYYTSGETTGSLRFTPIPDRSGVATITVTVEDGGLDNDLATAEGNSTVTETFVVTVTAVNDIPSLDSISDVMLDQSVTGFLVPLTGITAGAYEHQPLRITAASSDDELVQDPIVDYSSPSENGFLRINTQPGGVGFADVTVVVEDGGLDADLSTTTDNAIGEIQFRIGVGMSTFTDNGGSYEIVLRPDGQSVNISEAFGSLILSLSKGVWSGANTNSVYGNNFRVLEYSGAPQERFEIHINSTQDLNFAKPGNWKLRSVDVDNEQFFSVLQSTDILKRLLYVTTESPWQNLLNHSDVNNDGGITALDALQIINELSRRQYIDRETGSLLDPQTLDAWPGTYYDQNGDGSATALDALRVINSLARASQGGEGEAVTTDYWTQDVPSIGSPGTESYSDPFESEFEETDLIYSDADTETSHASDRPEDLVYATVGQESTEAVDSLLSDLEDWWK